MKTGRPKEENAKRKTITIRLSEDLYNKIIKYAAEHKLSKTDVALQSLEKFLSKEKLDICSKKTIFCHGEML